MLLICLLLCFVQDGSFSFDLDVLISFQGNESAGSIFSEFCWQ